MIVIPGVLKLDTATCVLTLTGYSGDYFASFIIDCATREYLVQDGLINNLNGVNLTDICTHIVQLTGEIADPGIGCGSGPAAVRKIKGNRRTVGGRIGDGAGIWRNSG